MAKSLRLIAAILFLIIFSAQASAKLPSLIPREVLVSYPERSTPIVSPDGQRLAFSQFYSDSNIWRLDPVTGLADAFNPNPSAGPYSIMVQPDGKILVAGIFHSIGSKAREFFARLDPVTERLLGAMITSSDNDAADSIYYRVGDAGQRLALPVGQHVHGDHGGDEQTGHQRRRRHPPSQRHRRASTARVAASRASATTLA